MKLLPFFLLLLLTTFQVQAQDLAGSADHPIISRYPGAEIRHYFVREYDEVRFVKTNQQGLPGEWLELAGKHTGIVYAGPLGRTPLEVMKNYREALEAAGAEIIYGCKGAGCDNGKPYYDFKFFSQTYTQSGRHATDDHYLYAGSGSQDQQYLVAKLPGSEVTTYLEIAVTGAWFGSDSWTTMEILEEKNMETGLVQVNADLIKEKIDKEGKIALYGIYFDTGKAVLKPESDGELTAIAEFLQRNPGELLYIVGHTDDTGSLSGNQTLAEQRAQAVVAALTQRYRVAANRLSGYGVGPLSPVADNRNETGRAKNRRVELVRRLR